MKTTRLVLILVPAAIVSVFAAYFLYREMMFVVPGPCSPSGFPGRCYHTKESMCEVLWNRFEGSCRDGVAKLNLPPAVLIGPTLFKCQSAKLDKAIAYSRVSNPECVQLFKELEDWRRGNSDFNTPF